MKMDSAEREMNEQEMAQRASEAEAALAKVRDELASAKTDLATLVVQKGELQLENAGLEDLVEDLRTEKGLIMDANEELHERVEYLEDEIELLSRSAQDIASLNAGRSSQKGRVPPLPRERPAASTRMSTTTLRATASASDESTPGTTPQSAGGGRSRQLTGTASTPGTTPPMAGGGRNRQLTTGSTPDSAPSSGGGGRTRQGSSLWPWSK